MTANNTDVLASILAELRDLKASHQALEARLDGKGSSNHSTPSSTLAQPISLSNGSNTSDSHPAVPLNGAGGAASPTLQFGSPNSPLPTAGLSSLHSQHGGSGILAAAARKMSTSNHNESSNSIKQDFINWARNTPPPKDNNGVKDSNAVSDKQIYTSRAVLTSPS
jgi:hypothetical protein